MDVNIPKIIPQITSLFLISLMFLFKNMAITTAAIENLAKISWRGKTPSPNILVIAINPEPEIIDTVKSISCAFLSDI
ncbi:hypothetical protein SDC9_135952 [bioreactor metagenome]|uniref:Uncharacterized protein n=1 Tax=bioreactor metagenome TaxID=1076179 RepID=A0A645DIK4_9ZZZZ